MIPDMNCKTCSHYNAGTNTCDRNRGAKHMLGCKLWYPNKEALEELSFALDTKGLNLAAFSRRSADSGTDEESVRKMAYEISHFISEHLFYMVAASFAAGNETLHFRLSCFPTPKGSYNA